MTQKILAILFVLSAGYEAHGEERLSKGTLDNFLGTLGGMSHATPLEGAGSHGINGLSLGVGSQETTARPSQLATYTRQSDGGDALTLSKLHLVKGFSWPLDLGLSFGAAEGNRVHQWQGYAQWTIFEKLGLPAVALRAFGSKLTGLRYTEINTAGAQIAVSQSIFRYVTVYGYLGRARHHARTVTPEGDFLDPVLFHLYGEDHHSYTRFWYDDVRALGVRALLLPPFFSLSLESQQTSSGVRTFLAKVAVGV